MNASRLEVRKIRVWSSCDLEQPPRGRSEQIKREPESPQKGLLPHVDPSAVGSLPWD